ncbi:DUF3892 domain-containing protein [Neobacillus sp. LXY-4]|uniref:DUF3892 domain-containing protein n=1 Tax=Neobacillus sp. LXY-4 TaxID=3379826 RepID=UPI003EE2098C
MSEETLIAVHRNHIGEILSFQTSTGRIISYRKAVFEVEEGKIHGVNVVEVPQGLGQLTPIDDVPFEQYPIIY